MSSEPITPQNNVTVIYQNVTTKVNVTVTETATVYVTTTVPLTSSIACLPSSQLMTTPTTSDQTTSKYFQCILVIFSISLLSLGSVILNTPDIRYQILCGHCMYLKRSLRVTSGTIRRLG